MLTIYFDYDVNVMTSYELAKYIQTLFKDEDVKLYEEVRDICGFLKQIKIMVKIT